MLTTWKSEPWPKTKLLNRVFHRWCSGPEFVAGDFEDILDAEDLARRLRAEGSTAWIEGVRVAR